MAGNAANKPYADTQVARFLQKRIFALRPRKTQTGIAMEVGWKSLNILSMIASGATKLPIECVPVLARALEIDAGYLLRLTLDQHDLMLWDIIESACGLVLTENEKKIIKIIRELSRNSDPAPTSKFLKALREVFGQ